MATAEQIPGVLDLTVVQGDDLSIQMTEATSFSAYTFVATVHELHGGTTTCTSSVVSSSASSTVQVDFPAALTEDLAVYEKNIAGTTNTGQIIRGICYINGYFE